MSNKTPSLQEVLTAHTDYTLSNVYTNIPGIVLAVKNMGQLIVDVQPTINVRTQDGDSNTERPPILNVPFEQPVSMQGGMTYPIKVGQPVWLKFSMRGMEVWKRGNGNKDVPADMRTFDPRDCVATPIYPFQESPNQPSKHRLPHNTDDVVLFHNLGQGSEVEIRLKPNGDCVVTSPANVIVNCKNAIVNAEIDVTANVGQSAIVNTGGDAVVNCDGNAAIETQGWSQLVSEGTILIKSEERVRIKGPSGSSTW